MLEYILVGAISAFVVFIPPVIFYEFSRTAWISPGLIIGLVIFGPLIRKSFF